MFAWLFNNTVEKKGCASIIDTKLLNVNSLREANEVSRELDKINRNKAYWEGIQRHGVLHALDRWHEHERYTYTHDNIPDEIRDIMLRDTSIP